MKTFRLFATLLVIALCAGFTSCSDDDEDENPLVGVWSYTWGGGNKEIVTFKSDGKGTWESYDVYDDECNTEHSLIHLMVVLSWFLIGEMMTLKLIQLKFPITA